MEDDAVPAANFSATLGGLAAQLPEDWDLVQLRGCDTKLPEQWAWVGEGLRVHRQGKQWLDGTPESSIASYVCR